MKTIQFTLLLCAIMISHCAYSATIYVNQAAAGGGGTTWGTAFNNLQDAIDIAVPGDQIWVAQGTYFPTKDILGSASPTDNRDKTFYIDTDGIQIYGGFIGTETMLSQRDWQNNVTILSGDLGGAGNADNAFHVMYLDGVTIGNITNATRIDGFTIEEGNGISGLFPRPYGGGIYGRADVVGTECSPNIHNCLFQNNSAADMGGGICMNINGGSTDMRVINCIFENNSSVLGGGIAEFRQTNVPSGNGISTAEIKDCIFYQNDSYSGGAYGGNYGTSNIDFDNCVFADNGNSFGEGGAIYLNTGGVLTVRYSTFSGNIAGNNRSGAISSRASTSGSSNSTIIENSVLWGNGTNQVYRISGANATLDFVHTLYEGNYNQSATELHKFDEDALFVDAANPKGADGIWRTADDGLNLQFCSPAINEGRNAFPVPTTDVTGSSRMGLADLGAYESVAVSSTPPTCDANSPMVGITQGLYRSKYKSAPDANGWTHYCDCNGNLVGSLQLGGTGAVVPADGMALKIFTQLHEYHADGVGFINNPNGAGFLTRKLEVYPTTQPSNPVGVRFFFTNTEFDILNHVLVNTHGQPAIPTVQDLTFYKVSNPNTNVYPEVPDLMPSDVIMITNHPTSASAGTWVYGSKGADHYAEYEVHSFSPTGGGGSGPGGTPLPVEWLSFDVKEKNGNANLSWSTATETNNKGFGIEYSTNGDEWRTIGFVEGQGSSSEVNTYEFAHKGLVAGTHYYRLKQMDFDDTFDYSEIRSIKMLKSGTITLSPNPVKDMLFVQHNFDGKVAFQIFDAKGRVMNQGTLQGNEIPTEELSNGVYIIQIENEGVLVHQRFVKQ